MSFLTNREIHVIGIQRTGQHAISSWLIGHFENVCYKNNMAQDHDRKTTMSHQSLSPPWWYFSPSTKEEWTVDESPSIDLGMDAVILGTEITLKKIGLNPNIPRQKKEICKLANVDEFSKSQDYVLVIRHPYNHYASILNWHRKKRLQWSTNFSETWIAMAKEVLGETNHVASKKIPILYDEWFVSEDYRKELSKKLNLEFSDRRLDVMMKIGVGKKWGSSFDGMQSKESVRSMDVLNRWKQVEDHPSFKEMIENEELIHYANKVGFKI